MSQCIVHMRSVSRDVFFAVCFRDSENKSEAAPEPGEALYKVDDKVLVWYGRGKNLRTYEAKVSGRDHAKSQPLALSS